MPDIFSFLINIDEKILLTINGLNTPFLDTLMWQASGKIFWLPLYILLAEFVYIRLGLKKALMCFVLIALLILFVDQVCASLLRPAIGRLRPLSPLNPISELLYLLETAKGGAYGFPSCHAANTFALATFLSFIIKKRWFCLSMMAWATLVSVSRVYLGYHYPTDIIVGASIGTLSAFGFYLLFKALTNIRLNYTKLVNIRSGYLR